MKKFVVKKHRKPTSTIEAGFRMTIGLDVDSANLLCL
jgi:hypothetical protein